MIMPHIDRLTITFYGHVQGVGFRTSVYKTVEKWNTQGFVQNCQDGSVLVVIECTKAQANLLIEQMQRAFSITKVKIEEQHLLPNLPQFHIKISD